MRAFLLVVAVCLGACNQPQAAQYPPPVMAYLDALAALEAAPQPVSMEPLFAAAGAAQDALMAIQDGSDQAWQETLSDDQYARLRKDLRGMALSRGHDVYAQLDGAALSALAQAHGNEADRAFFARYAELWSEEMLPRYLRFGTGQSPCVRFGEDIVVPLYRAWWAYWAAYPQHYATFTLQTLRDLEEVVELGTCACGDVDSVRAELRAFNSAFPHSPVNEVVQQRLAELSREDIDHYVHCR